MARGRTSIAALGRLLATSTAPTYAVDEQQRFVFANPALAAWLGTEIEPLLGQPCEYHAQFPEGDPRLVVSGLCPPPEAFRGRRLTGVVGCRNAAGQYVRRRAEFLPLPLAASLLGGVLGVLAPNDLTETAPVDDEPARWHQLLRVQREQLEARFRIDQLVGDSPAARRLREQVQLAAATRARVVVCGPPGSGREHVTRTIHLARANSDRSNPARDVPHLVPVACALFDGELIHSTIMAVLRQSPPSDTYPQTTLLLLEVDRLAPDGQQELAAFLAVPGFRLPILATARRSLAACARDGQIAPELAHALTTLEIELPPLCERHEDVPLLIQQFVEVANARSGRMLGGFLPEATDRMLLYSWPQNLDELATVVREACERAEGPHVKPSDLPSHVLLAAGALAHPPRRDEPLVLDEYLEQTEKELIRRALKRSRNNRSRAARLLGISRPRLLRRIEQLGLQADDGREPSN